MASSFKPDETVKAALKDLEEKYKALIMVSSEVIFRMSADWSTMTELYGRGFLADTDKPDAEWREKYIHPHEHIAVDKAISEALNKRSAFEYEHRVLKADGGTGWIYTRAVPLFDENGDISEWFGTASDITNRKQQEEALRESEKKYQEIIEYAPAGIFEVDFLKKRFLSVNDVACRYSGYSREELLAMNPEDFLDEEGVAKLKSRIDKWLGGMRPEFNVEYKVKNREGREIYALLNVHFTKDEEGRPRGATVVAHDITERKKMEQELHFLVGILESVNEAILVLDDKLNVIYWNKVAERISGWSAEEIMGQGASNEFFNSASLSAREDIAKSMEMQHHYAGEITANRKDKKVIHIDIHIRGIKNEKGERKYSVASFRDITQRINTERQLISSKQKIELLASIPRRLLESANPQSIINDLCNEAMERIACDIFFNYFVDSTKRRIYLNAYGGVPEEAAKKVEWLEYGSAVCGCVAKEGKRIVAECIAETPDERTKLIAALGIKAYACHPLKTGGKVIGTLAFGTRKRNSFTEDELAFMSTVSDYIAIAMGCLLENRKLKDSKRRALRLAVQLNVLKNELTDEVQALNTLYNLNSNFIIQDDLNSIYKGILEAAVSLTSASKGAIQIYNEHECRLELIMGLNFGADFDSRFKYMDLEMGNCGKAFKARKRIIDEDVRVSFAGKPGLDFLLEEGIVAVQSTPLISSSGKMAGILNTYYAENKKFNERELRMLDLLARLAADTIERTVTEEALKNSEKKALALVRKLEEADRNKNRFINVLSHELRNPLATIMAGVSLLDVTDDAELAAHAKSIMKRQSAQLCRLVDDLLDVARINQNKIKIKKQRIDLKRVIREAAEDYKPRFLEKGVSLRIDAEGSPLYLEADAARVTQAAANLLHNSLKFTKKGGAVEISVYRDKDAALISVKDSGAGIKKDMLQKLFLPFMQYDEYSGSSGGLGLGLSIAKGIAELHGGSISVRSEGPEKGSEFIIHLPGIISDEVKEDIQCGAVQPSRSLDILVIEDNQEYARLLCAMLSEAGHRPVLACGGLEGFRTARSMKPDVVLCDIGLPGISGYEVAKLIRKNKRLKCVKLIALTGYATQGDINLSKSAGFDIHIAKPVSIETLSNVLAQLG